MEGQVFATASFHYICHGHCFVHIPGREPTKLVAGDLLLFPRSQEHVLSASAKLAGSEVTTPENISLGLKQEGTAIICAIVEMEQVKQHPLLEQLPDIVVVHNDPVKEPWLGPFMQLINNEVTAMNPGYTAAMDKLADLLFIQIIRCYLQSHQPEKGMLAAMRDPKLHKLLKIIHEHLSRNWTLDLLAEQIGMSRSVLADKFKQVMGVSVMQYLHDWRMQHANYLLQEEKQEVISVSEACGYQSESAFSKAFKKCFGYGPGAARKKHLSDN